MQERAHLVDLLERIAAALDVPVSSLYTQTSRSEAQYAAVQSVLIRLVAQLRGTESPLTREQRRALIEVLRGPLGRNPTNG